LHDAVSSLKSHIFNFEDSHFSAHLFFYSAIAARLPFQSILPYDAVSNLKSQIFDFDDSHFSAYFFFHSAMAASFSFNLFSNP
jgi:hypothetical protein